MIGEFCIVRTRNAGVHMGTIIEINPTSAGASILLHDARRLWYWTGAFSLNEVANEGVGEDSRISQPTAKILLTEAIEVIWCTPKAKANLSRSRNCA